MRFIDPDGMDEWEINNQGQIVNRVTTDQHDAFFMVDTDGARIDGQSVSFEYGTINQSTVTVNSEDGKSSWSYDAYTVNGGENATSLFHFVADNTNVEWSHGVFGKNGEQSSNIITTAHKEKNEAGMIDQYMAKFMEGIPIIEHTHNHPNTIYAPFPSGLPDTGYDGGDIAFSKSITLGTGMISETAPTFKLYIPQEKKTYKYGPNSVKTDFQFFNKK